MTGRLKIIRVLQNPKPRKGLKRRRPMKRRAAKRKAKGSALSYVLRMIDGGRDVRWWNGKRWTARHAEAKRYNSAGRAVPALRAARKKAPPDFIVLDAVPA